MEDSVCAVVLAYNRKKFLIESLEALRMQSRPLQGIYLIDNVSTDGTPELLWEKGYIYELPPLNINEPWEREFIITNLTNGEPIKFHYVRMHRNTGTSGGFYEGMKRAFEKGYQWLWVMDDDVEPLQDCLEKLSFHFDKKVLVPLQLFEGIISSLSSGIKVRNWTFLITRPITEEEFIERDLVEIDIAPWGGILINREIIEQVGYPDMRFFMHYCDADFCLRVRRVTRIFLVKEAKVLHKWKTATRTINPYTNVKLWRQYYLERNKIIFRKRHIKNKLAFLTFIFADFILLGNKMIKRFLQGYPWKEAKLLYYAFLDGITENFERDFSEIV